MKEPSIISRAIEIALGIDKIDPSITGVTIKCSLREKRDAERYVNKLGKSLANIASMDEIHVYGKSITLEVETNLEEDLALKAQEVLGIGDGETDSLIEAFNEVLSKREY